MTAQNEFMAKNKYIDEVIAEEKIADFLQERGYEGAVPIYTALLIESLTPLPSSTEEV